ncbi:MAG: carboxyl-terminal processing protease, partial [Flavobacteriales bacterium]
MKKIYILIFLITSNFGAFSQKENTEEFFEISKNLTIFSEVYKNINFYFVDETNPGELMKTGIDAMLKSLDPYTNFIPESNIEDYRMMQSGQYGGIGSLIRKQGEFVQITNPYKGFPAQKAGLKAGDLIKEIDGKSIEGK